MGQIVLLETFGTGLLPFGADIRDLTLKSGPSGFSLQAFAGDGISARMAQFNLDVSASFQGNSFLGPSHDGFILADFGAMDFYLSVSRIGDELTASPGDARAAVSVSSLNSGFMGDTLLLVGASAGAAQVVIATQPGVAGLSIAAVTGSTLSTFSALPDFGEGHITDLATLSMGGETWVLASSDGNDSLISYTLSQAGAVTYTSEFGAADGLGIGDAVALRTVNVDGQPYVLVAGAESSSISVLSMEPDGSFRAVDHVLDSLQTRFADIVRLETTVVNGVTYVVAAGSDDGFSLFQIRPDGKLLHLSSVADGEGTVLDNPSALALAFGQGALHIAVASGTEAGISHFRYDLSTKGSTLMGGSPDDTIGGTALDDMILGAGGNDTLSGMAGNDILIDGADSDILNGGAGQDLFVFHADGVSDTIQDFERGIDQLDLSFWPGLYTLNLAMIVTTANGATLTFGDETISIRAADGNPLTRADLALRPAFNLDRPALVLNDDPTPSFGLISGGEGDDVVMGTLGSETLSGGLGNDVLEGGAGADRLFGGGGYDVSTYASASTAVFVDLYNPAANTGDAAGDQLYSVESIVGSDYDDTLLGGTAADDLRGGLGDDKLYGRAGNDLLQGGYGDDWLSGSSGRDILDGGAGRDVISGGSGNDRLFGGSGIDNLSGGSGNDILSGGSSRDYLNGGSGKDTASYSDATGGVSVKLSRNKGTRGDAAGDKFKSIERLEGSDFADRLVGGKRGDHIWGGGGNDVIKASKGSDRLYGGDGNDVLDGSKGKDRLTGGAGNDYLKGGSGRDSFYFDEGFGADRIKGFNARQDRLYLDLELFDQPPARASAVVADLAHVVGRSTVLDFGEGNTITLKGFHDLSGLSDALFFG